MTVVDDRTRAAILKAQSIPSPRLFDPDYNPAPRYAATHNLPAEVCRRWGPQLFSVGLWGAVGASLLTYAHGLYALTKKDRDTFNKTFARRIIIVGWLLPFAACATDVVPVPFKERVEQALGVKAQTVLRPRKKGITELPELAVQSFKDSDE